MTLLLWTRKVTCLMWYILFSQVNGSPACSSPRSFTHQSRDSSLFGKCTVSEDSSFGEEIQCSKGLFLCSAADAASTMDYSKSVDLNEGVVDSPPSRGALPTSTKSPSPLRTQTWTPGGRDRSTSPPRRNPKACQIPQRKLYGPSVVEGLVGWQALLPRPPLSIDGVIPYRYSRREAIMRGLEKLRGGSSC